MTENSNSRRSADPWPRRYDLAERIGSVLGDVLWPALFGYLLWRHGR